MEIWRLFEDRLSFVDVEANLIIIAKYGKSFVCVTSAYFCPGLYLVIGSCTALDWASAPNQRVLLIFKDYLKRTSLSSGGSCWVKPLKGPKGVVSLSTCDLACCVNCYS